MRKNRLLPALLLLLPTACGDDDDASVDSAPTTAASPDEQLPTPDTADLTESPGLPVFDAAAIVDGVDNPWMPLAEGARWVYEGTVEGETERTEVVVTDERREILGVDAVVVRDTVSVDGEVTEDTYDWFAQDDEGNVWYLGEATEEYEDGEVVSTEGSWEAGVDGAEPGLIMAAGPLVGMRYRQEQFPGEAEDMAEVVAVGDQLVIFEWNPLEPGVAEHKIYEQGTGLVAEVEVVGGDARFELVDHDPGHS